MRRTLLAACAALLLSACGGHGHPAQLVRDPVCGMMIDPVNAPKSDYKGKIWYFCSQEDKQRFDKSPAQFAPK